MTGRRIALALLCLGLSAPSCAADAGEMALGKRLFAKDAVPACAVCHALKEAGATGAIGPSLDELRPDEQRVMKAIRNGIGQMPAYTNLTDKEIEAIARYVTKASRAN